MLKNEKELRGRKIKTEINEPKIIVSLIYRTFFFMCKKFFNQSGQVWGKKENTTLEIRIKDIERNQFYMISLKNSR